MNHLEIYTLLTSPPTARRGSFFATEATGAQNECIFDGLANPAPKSWWTSTSWFKAGSEASLGPALLAPEDSSSRAELPATPSSHPGARTELRHEASHPGCFVRSIARPGRRRGPGLE